MKKYLKYFLFLSILFFNHHSIAQECKSKSNLKVGLLDNDFIDYRHYLYYELGNYALAKNIEFEFEYVDGNIEKFDLINEYSSKLQDYYYKKSIHLYSLRQAILSKELVVKQKEVA